MSEQQIDTEPPMNLPKPQVEQQPPGAAEAGLSQNPLEAAQTAALEKGLPTSGGAMPVTVDPASSVGLPATAGIPGNQAAFMVQATQSMPQIADDVDLIEKEWVDKAKEIVERTKADPYAQNKEMSMVKADYLKKRYNKDIKPAED